MLAWLTTQLHNPVFSGAAGFSIIGGAVFLLRQLPGQIGRALKACFSSSVTVTNDADIYDHLLRWLGPRLTGWHVRKLSLTTKGDGFDRRDERWVLAPGFGGFWFTFDRWPFHISREVSAPDSGGKLSGRVRETLTITCPSLGRKRLIELVTAAEREVLDLDAIRVFQYANYWRLVDTLTPRGIDTVALPSGTMESIIEDIERFKGASDSYHAKGIPYRRGYLFSGAPGTGKTSTAIALAGHFHLPIYVLGLSSINSDNELFSAFAEVPRGALLLIEDIDAAGVTVARKATEEDEPADRGVTLSGLLNVIDGVVAKEGRLLIMTSNHPERLDAALVRPGRVDRAFAFGLADEAQARAIFRRFFGTSDALLAYTERSPAEIQGICLSHEGRAPEAAAALSAS